jgi:hypothetical protein
MLCLETLPKEPVVCIKGRTLVVPNVTHAAEASARFNLGTLKTVFSVMDTKCQLQY